MARKKSGRPKSAPPKNVPGGPRPGAADRPGVRIRWERRNLTLLGAGLAAAVLGYILLSQGDVTAAPRGRVLRSGTPGVHPLTHAL